MKTTAFSLIEVSIALLLIIGGLLIVFNQGFYFTNRIKNRLVAYNLAQKILEEYFDWEELDTLDGNSDGIVTNGSYTDPPYPVTINNVTYTPVLDISDGPVLGTHLKHIEVTISWGGKSFTLGCLKAHY